jgi:hypothetical protein
MGRREWTKLTLSSAFSPYPSTGLSIDLRICFALPTSHGQIGEVPELWREGNVRPMLGLRRLSAVASVVDSSGARDLRARRA